MTAAIPADGHPVITSWHAISPFGKGRADFVDGLRAGRVTAAALDAASDYGPDRHACLVPDFDIREVLGRKGTRAMDRITGFAIAAIGQLLHASGGSETAGRAAESREDLAVVLGTTAGSVQSSMDFTRSSLLAEKPFYVDPGVVPNSVMNCAAGHAAIWHGIKGPNATVAGGRLAGLLALNYGRRLLHSGRARAVLCGAVEEHSSARAWLEHHSRADPAPSDTVLGEGCAVLVIRPPGVAVAGERPTAEILAVDSRAHIDGELRETAAACVAHALERAGVRAEEVWAVAPGGASGPAGRGEQRALEAMCGGAIWIRCASLIGDTGAASAMFQIAAVLSTADRAPDSAGRAAVVTAVERDGTVACAVLRMLGGGSSE